MSVLTVSGGAIGGSYVCNTSNWRLDEVIGSWWLFCSEGGGSTFEKHCRRWSGISTGFELLKQPSSNGTFKVEKSAWKSVYRLFSDDGLIDWGNSFIVLSNSSNQLYLNRNQLIFQ